MQKYVAGLIAQFKEFYAGLTPTKKVSLMLSCAIIATTLAIITMMVSGRSYVTLFKNIPEEHVPTIISLLKEKGINYKAENGGKDIMVSPELVHSTQMAIMTETGLENIGTTGLEIFQNQDVGTTSYAQRINYQRALQGELVRAINSLEVVKQSKVILAMPPKKAFLEETSPPTASVVVDIFPGKSLTRDQIKGITFLVASAVEHLEPKSVTVVDSRGKTLSKNKNSDSAAMSDELLELKEKMENQLEENIETVLSKVVGVGKVIAKVNADINLKEIAAVEETVDPDRTAIRSVQREEQKLNGARTNPTGVPGARANIPGAQEAGEVGFRQDVNKELGVTNYEVPKTVTKFSEAPGKLEKVSIAVLVDGKTEFKTDENGVVTETWSERSPEEIKKYEALVKNMIGFSTKRGDSITVENIRFVKEDFTESAKLLSTLERKKLISYIIKWSILGLAFSLFFFFVVRPFMRWITDSFNETVDDMLPKTLEELEDLQSIDNTLPGMTNALPTLEETLDPDKVESELLKERIMVLMERDNKKAADALSLWLVRREL